MIIPDWILFTLKNNQSNQPCLLKGTKSECCIISVNAYVPGDKKGWIEFIRTIDGKKWNTEQKCWRLPMVQATFMALEKFFAEDVIANFNLPKQLPEYWHHPNATLKKSRKKVANKFQERALIALEEKLMLEHKRYTISS